MEYNEWYELLVETARGCGQDLLQSIYRGEYKDETFLKLQEIINTNVEIEESKKARAIYSAIMVSAFEVANEQKVMVDTLI